VDVRGSRLELSFSPFNLFMSSDNEFHVGYDTDQIQEDPGAKDRTRQRTGVTTRMEQQQITRGEWVEGRPYPSQKTTKPAPEFPQGGRGGVRKLRFAD
jgi:hypothetical protein